MDKYFIPDPVVKKKKKKTKKKKQKERKDFWKILNNYEIL